MKKLSFLFLFVIFLMAGCQTNPSSDMAQECNQTLKLANEELNFAKTKGFSGTVEYTKAATLITGAEIQYQFGKYPNCIDKVKRARWYIKNSQVPK